MTIWNASSDPLHSFVNTDPIAKKQHEAKAQRRPRIKLQGKITAETDTSVLSSNSVVQFLHQCLQWVQKLPTDGIHVSILLPLHSVGYDGRLQQTYVFAVNSVNFDWVDIETVKEVEEDVVVPTCAYLNNKLKCLY